MTATRSADEIQAAHDRLVAIIAGEVPNPFATDLHSMPMLVACTDVLCWVLQHEHNQTFADNLRKIDQLLAERGYRLQGRPQ